jgi:hypothetical protein
MSARISTPSRPAASMTACSACSAAWRSCARSTISASRRSIRSSSPTGPTRKARASRRRCWPPACSPASTTRTGPMTADDARTARRFGDELAHRLEGRRGSRRPRKMQAFFELHIEQGPILEAEGKDIGVVTHGQGLSWTQVTVTGKDAIPAPRRCRCARMPASAWRGCWNSSTRSPGATPACGRRGRPYRRLSEFAQRDPRQGGLHGRFPLAGPGRHRPTWKSG